MRLKPIYQSITECMNPIITYEGTDLEALLESLNEVNLLLNKTLVRYRPERFYNARIGLLEDNPMIIAGVRTGLLDTRTRTELGGIVLFPSPSRIDRSIAMLDRNGRITAVYENDSGYASFAEYNSGRSGAPTSRESILEDLLVGPYELEASRGLSGAEIAVRYLAETPKGQPLGFDL